MVAGESEVRKRVSVMVLFKLVKWCISGFVGFGLISN